MALFPRARNKRDDGAPAAPACLVPEAEALVAASFSFLELGSGDGVAVIGGDGNATILDTAQVSVLQAFNRPCAPETLARRLLEHGWDQDDLGQATGIIRRLVASGHLHKLGNLLEASRAGQVPGGASRTEGPGLGLLAIPTKDRHGTLERALNAWKDALGELPVEGSLPDILVSDDSVNEYALTKSVVESFAATYAGSTLFLDRVSRIAFAEALVPAGGRAAAFALGLDGGPAGLGRYGAARNLILLAAAGRAVALADDDMLPDFRIHPDASKGLSLSSDPDPTVIRPFADCGVLADWLSPAEGTVESPHRSILGRSTRELLLESEALDVSNADSTLLESSLGIESRVAALCFGTWGDSGIPTNRYLLALRGLVDPRATEVYEVDKYEEALCGRMVFRSTLCTTLGGRVFMGGHIALDARSLLPPFGPYGKDEDGLWGFCLGILHQELMIAYPARSMLHEPPNARSSTREEALRWDLWLNETLRVVLGLLASRHESGEAAYTSLGGRLRSIASGPRPGFRSALAEASARSIAARIGLLEQALAEYGREPAAWAADMDAAVTALTTRLQEPRFWLPRELESIEPEKAETILADYLVRFGELLEAWPGLFNAAMRVGPDFLEQARIR